jgi:thiamine-phosphate pyrophosphorylase
MIIISDPLFIPNESTVINALFDNGLDVFHLRKPESKLVEMENLISQIDQRFHSRIMIHSHYKLLNSFPLRGIHFTGKTKNRQVEFFNCECFKSIGIHSLDEFRDVKPLIDSVFLSPVFPSVSKAGYSKQWDFEELKVSLSNDYKFEIIALGGITLDNYHKTIELGFDNFALLGSIWEPVKADYSTSQIIDIYRKFNNDK